MDSGCASDLQFVDLEWNLLLVKILKYNVFERHSNETKLTLRGKAKTKIHARYPFLGGGTYQPPVLSVSFLQVGY